MGRRSWKLIEPRDKLWTQNPPSPTKSGSTSTQQATHPSSSALSDNTHNALSEGRRRNEPILNGDRKLGGRAADGREKSWMWQNTSPKLPHPCSKPPCTPHYRRRSTNSENTLFQTDTEEPLNSGYSSRCKRELRRGPPNVPCKASRIQPPPSDHHYP